VLATDDKSRRYRAILALALYGYALGLAYTAERYVEAYPAYDTTFDIISIVVCVVVASAIFGYNVGTRHLRPCAMCEERNAQLPEIVCADCTANIEQLQEYLNERRFYRE
jgi:hypothetical protein